MKHGEASQRGEVMLYMGCHTYPHAVLAGMNGIRQCELDAFRSYNTLVGYGHISNDGVIGLG